VELIADRGLVLTSPQDEELWKIDTFINWYGSPWCYEQHRQLCG